jgi:gliding motility-associated-like protein
VQGCDSLLLHHVLVLPLPAADAGADQTIRYGDTALLHASGGLAFVWNNGINMADNQVHPISTTNYFVQVTDANNCSAFDSVLVTVQIPQTMLIMPDAFTPNADGLNDYLFPINTDNYSQVGLMVINRWGEVIYNENSIAKGWDGNYMGTPQPIGTYVYMINATEKLTGKQIQIQGSVSLVR